MSDRGRLSEFKAKAPLLSKPLHELPLPATSSLPFILEISYASGTGQRSSLEPFAIPWLRPGPSSVLLPTPAHLSTQLGDT